MAEEAGMFMVLQTIGSKHVILVHCPECDTCLDPPTTGIRAQLESRELMEFCLKKLKLKSEGVNLVNAEFIWTEPHSKRIKLRVRVQKEVLNGAILEQAYVVEYVQQEHMCDSCTRVQANPDQWVAAVQLRQHLILKHDAAVRAIKIKQMDHGIDFFFGNRSHGVKFVEFVGKVAPVRSRNDKQLLSHDTKSNNYNYKYTFSVEISPICREELICLSPRVAVGLGNLGPLVICTKVTNSIALLDPFTLRQCFLDQYWRTPFNILYLMWMDIVSPEVNVGGSRCALADAQVARVSDFGKNDTMFYIKTHLGHILKPGDYAHGYDLHGANSNDMELNKYRDLAIPELILVKKSYEEKRHRKRGKPRRGDEEKMNSEYEQFLRDLEENPELRFNISLYRNKEYQPSDWWG
ncbi:hypothetical protein POPTR_017G137500v4 [Populus trichocarpa]|uniref:Uncharacterized protein n=1 Tax=Populus trichocarpa TaxID=3694 RepID=A0ACC0RRK0_POPTR|nr:hypothetical protein POPTR_017G137500v4 [Populus trichocarpa]